MPDQLTEEPPAPALSRYGIASAVLAVVAVAAAVLAAMIWSGHRDEAGDLAYRTRVLQTAAEWTGGLVNMNKDNVAGNLQKLRDGTVGQLNVEFDQTVEPFKAIVAKLQAQTVGQVESVSLESLRHQSGDGDKPPADQPELAAVASRTDTVLVVATSVSQNAGGKPQTVRWNLRLGVSDVDGKLLISRLEAIR
ncbi:hypothetical protein SBI67_08905 [Mycolicibacterium sp. 120266]|uniref:hypothetical protein n=1 Tax=Mycolicibacterium sp. 120266 TaxID=3090601 RepID=UPI00299EF95C|nr:hypothetical protein [Mycolicibacterium sp. 120266]MDX1872238.1 hypothetical protein [Mycolicibacterium sp. 120266]